MLVLKFRLDARYVLDDMTLDLELPALLQYGYYAEKDNWEQTRFMAWITAQMNSTKKIKMEDIIKFTWENEQPQQLRSKEDLKKTCTCRREENE